VFSTLRFQRPRLRNRLPVGGGCVYVLQIFLFLFLFFVVFFVFFRRNHDASSLRFDTIPECDGQTDGQTDMSALAIPALA